MQREISAKPNAKYKMNFIIRILIASDFVIWSSVNMVTAVFALFIVDDLGGNIETVGVAAMIYFAVKVLAEIPIGYLIDRNKSEQDDLRAVIWGAVVTAFVYLFYPLIDSIMQLYLLQVVAGIGAALSFPAWYSIFTRHVDKRKAGFEWSFYDVLLGLGIAGAATLGAFLIEFAGFDVVFYLIGILVLLGTLPLLFIRNKIL